LLAQKHLMKSTQWLLLLCMFALSACDGDDEIPETPPIIQFSYDEAVDGDLSDEFDNPSGPFELVNGINSFVTLQRGEAPRDIDYFTFELKSGFKLSEIIVGDFAGDSDNLAFIGLQLGSPFDNDAFNTTADQLLGGTLYGFADIRQNILPEMAQLEGASGFTLPLISGVYTIWLNQTGRRTTARLDFVVTNE